MKTRLMEVTKQLQEKLLKLEELRNATSQFKTVEEQTKVILFKEAKDVEGVKTVVDKENYVKEILFDSTEYINRKNSEHLANMLEAEIKGLKYEHRALITLLNLSQIEEK